MIVNTLHKHGNKQTNNLTSGAAAAVTTKQQKYSFIAYTCYCGLHKKYSSHKMSQTFFLG
jgi:RNase P subunit RPR2